MAEKIVKDSQGLAKDLVNDTISRQAAITAIQNAYCDTEGGEDKCAVWKNVGLTNALHIMQDLPSAQPERKKGTWIIKDNPGTGWYRVTCSECGEDVTSTAPCIGFYPNAKVTWDYCPNCGAKMREVSK